MPHFTYVSLKFDPGFTGTLIEIGQVVQEVASQLEGETAEQVRIVRIVRADNDRHRYEFRLLHPTTKRAIYVPTDELKIGELPEHCRATIHQL